MPKTWLPYPLTLGGQSPLQFLMRLWYGFFEHEILTRSMAIGFSAMMATVPFLAVVLSMVVHLLPDLDNQKAAAELVNLNHDQVASALLLILPKEAVDVVIDQIVRLRHEPPSTWLLAMLLISSSGLLAAIFDSINRIYGLKKEEPKVPLTRFRSALISVRDFVKIRFIATLITIFQAAALLASLVVIVTWPQLVVLLRISPEWLLLAAVIKWLSITIMVLASFTLCFRFGPAQQHKKRWLTPGGLFGCTAFICVCLGFRIYVQRYASYSTTYGSLAGVVVLMFWYWLTGIVLLLSAEINRVVDLALAENNPQPAEPPQDNAGLGALFGPILLFASSCIAGYVLVQHFVLPALGLAAAPWQGCIFFYAIAAALSAAVEFIVWLVLVQVLRVFCRRKPAGG